MAGKRKYTSRVIEQMRAMRAEGMLVKDIALRFGCDPTTASRLLKHGTSDSAKRHLPPQCIIIDVERQCIHAYTPAEHRKKRQLNLHERKFVAGVARRSQTWVRA